MNDNEKNELQSTIHMHPRTLSLIRTSSRRERWCVSLPVRCLGGVHAPYFPFSSLLMGRYIVLFILGRSAGGGDGRQTIEKRADGGT